MSRVKEHFSHLGFLPQYRSPPTQKKINKKYNWKLADGCAEKGWGLEQ